MIVLSIPLTLVTFAMVAVMLFCSRKLAGFSGGYFMKQQQDLGKENGFIEEMLSGQKVVKVFNHEEENIQRFNELNESLYESSNNAHKFANIMMPVNAQLGNISYVIVAIVGGILAITGFSGLTLGELASFLTFNKSFNMPINQISMQINSIVMALAGAGRIFEMMNEKPETDEGYVMLVNAHIDENGEIHECQERTGTWAWKHYHKDSDTTTYVKQEGNIIRVHMNLIGDEGAVQVRFTDIGGDAALDGGKKSGFRSGNLGMGLTQAHGIHGAFQLFRQHVRRCGLQDVAETVQLQRALGVIKQWMPCQDQ